MSLQCYLSDMRFDFIFDTAQNDLSLELCMSVRNFVLTGVVLMPSKYNKSARSARIILPEWLQEL